MLLPSEGLAPFVLTRDTTCRDDCLYFGRAMPAHSHYRQADPAPSPRRADGRVWRLLFRIWGNGPAR